MTSDARSMATILVRGSPHQKIWHQERAVLAVYRALDHHPTAGKRTITDVAESRCQCARTTPSGPTSAKVVLIRQSVGEIALSSRIPINVRAFRCP